MSNINDSNIIKEMMSLPEQYQAEYFRQNAHRLQDDATYWNILGTLWKLGGTVIQQGKWKELFLATRKNKHKIMKTRERRRWRRLPVKVTAYRAINNIAEIDTAISWTLSRGIAERFSEGRKIAERTFKKKEIFALFDRRGEDEILVNISKENNA